MQHLSDQETFHLLSHPLESVSRKTCRIQPGDDVNEVKEAEQQKGSVTQNQITQKILKMKQDGSLDREANQSEAACEK